MNTTNNEATLFIALIELPFQSTRSFFFAFGIELKQAHKAAVMSKEG